MAIASDERVLNATRVSLLPPSWGAIYELGAAEIKLRAVRRIGELSSELETAQGFASIRPDGGTNATKLSVLKGAGISTSAAQRYERVAAIPAAEIEAYKQLPAIYAVNAGRLKQRADFARPRANPLLDVLTVCLTAAR